MNKKLVAIVFAALFIGVAPATAINMGGEITADPMAVRGRGADASQILENATSNSTAENNSTAETSNTVSDTASTEQIATVENNDSVTSTNDQATGADTQIYDTSENTTISQATEDTQLNDTTETIPINTTGIVMQSTDYSCGPAALATVLQNMGFNSTEGELKVLAGTDETGTSMYGLVRAAQAKGVNAVGMRLSIDELRHNMIVHVIKDGTPHYSVVKEITNEIVRLADPSLGNIEMTREKFNEIYTGNALVITTPMKAPGVSVNETRNQTGSVQAENQTLTAETMQSISGKVVITKALIIATFGAIKIKVIKIAKAAWNMGIRGRELKRRIRIDILNRLPPWLRRNRRVRRAVDWGTAGLMLYMVYAIPRNRFCWWTAGNKLKTGAIAGFLRG